MNRKAGKQKKRSQLGEIWHRLKKSPTAMVSLCLIIVLVLCAAFAPYLTPYDYAKQDLGDKLQFPSGEHPFGTDNFGRDILTRILYGARISLLVSLMAVCISVVFALLLGPASGFFGGAFDTVLMRILDIIQAIPGMLLSIVVSVALGTGLVNTAIAISIGCIPPLARQLRAAAMTIRNEEYIEAAQSFGAGKFYIILHHIIPNILAPLIIEISLRIGSNINAIAGLSFVGLGVQPPTPEWGNMLSSGRQFIQNFWPLITFPGVAIALTMLSCNLLGDGLRDAMDPRLKR